MKSLIQIYFRFYNASYKLFKLKLKNLFFLDQIPENDCPLVLLQSEYRRGVCHHPDVPPSAVKVWLGPVTIVNVRHRLSDVYRRQECVSRPVKI